MSKNRQQRRHPIHHALPLPGFSDEKVPVEKIHGKPDSKGTMEKKGKRHGY